MKTNLLYKRVLLMAPRFYGYYQLIKKELEDAGADVLYVESEIFLEDRRHNTQLVDWLFRYLRNPRYRTKHTREVLQQIGDKSFDYMLVLSVYSPSYQLIDILKNRNPNMQTCIYFWDAFSTWNFAYQMDYFDRKFSFDFNDCQKYRNAGLVHLPLFYTREQVSKCRIEYDLVHIGSLHPKYQNRAQLIARLYDQAQQLGLKTFFHLVYEHPDTRVIHYPLKYILKYIFNSEYRKYVKNTSMLYSKYQFISNQMLPLEKVREIENSARCIVDININRSGVAMRIIGALAAGKKVITNNRYIIHEAFYDPANIYILDEGNVEINTNFIDSSCNNLDMGYLRIDNWLDKLLEN